MRQAVLVFIGFVIAFPTAYWMRPAGAPPEQGSTIPVRGVAYPTSPEGVPIDDVVRDVLASGFRDWGASSAQRNSLTALVTIIDLVNESTEHLSGIESVDSEFLPELLELWADGNDAGALAQLSTIEQPAIQRAAAVLLVALRQFDDRSVKEVLGSVPAAEQAYLFAEVVAAQAADSPERALDAAASSETALLRRLGVRRIAESLAYNDSEVVFDHASDIDDLALRSVFVTAAVTALAYQDPERAFSRLQSHQEKLAREDFFGLIARAYVRLDARAAWEWATELASDYRAKVFDEIAIGNREYAAQLMRTELERDALDIEFLSVVLESSGSLLLETISTDEFSSLLARLTEFNGNTAESIIALVLSQWRDIDPVNAVQWAYSNPRSVPDSLIDNLAAQIAESDLAEAARVLNALTGRQQADWMYGVAQAVTLRDFQSAMAWLASYQSLPGYEDAVVRAFNMSFNQFAFPRGGLSEEAAPMLETSSLSVRRRALMNFTTSWSMQDPVKALDWAMQVGMSPDTEVHRHDAIRSGLAQFIAQDAAAAREWALELPPGSNRDVAIGSFVIQSEQTGDLVLMDQIENQTERTRAARAVAGRLWREGDREGAISILEVQFPDQSERDSAYALISAQQQLPPGVRRIVR